MNDHFSTVPEFSYWPILLALAVVLIAIGVVSTFVISIFGLTMLFAAIIGWTWENRSRSREAEND